MAGFAFGQNVSESDGHCMPCDGVSCPPDRNGADPKFKQHVLDYANSFRAVLERHPHVRLVLSGHVHFSTLDRFANAAASR